MRNKSVAGYRVYLENAPPYIVGVAKPRAQRGEAVIERQYKTEDEALVSFNAAQTDPAGWLVGMSDFAPAVLAGEINLKGTMPPESDGDPNVHSGQPHYFRKDDTCRCGAVRDG